LILSSLFVLSNVLATAGVDVVFLSEAPDAPSVVVTLDNDGKKRTLAYAVLPPSTSGSGATTFHGDLADDQGTRSALARLPQAPRGAGLVERDGALSFTVDDAGEWERAWAHLVPSKGAGALPVPGPKGLRLVVHGTIDGGPSSAVLYGNKVRVAGTAVVRTSSHVAGTTSDARGVVTSAGVAPAVKPALFLEASGTTVDRVAACRREAPSAISVVTSSLAMKLYAKGTIACAGALAIVPVEGVKLDAKKDVPVRGVVVAR
jgi:hypothetical protein